MAPPYIFPDDEYHRHGPDQRQEDMDDSPVAPALTAPTPPAKSYGRVRWERTKRFILGFWE